MTLMGTTLLSVAMLMVLESYNPIAWLPLLNASAALPIVVTSLRRICKKFNDLVLWVSWRSHVFILLLQM